MSEESEKVAQFTAITGATDDRARFYLESASGELEVAVSRYYENDGHDDDDDVEIVDNPVNATTESPPVALSKQPKPKSRNSNFATLNSIAHASDDDEEEGQAFYAGGSEQSGQQVLGPPKKKDIVADMFKSVQEHGVEILDQGASTSRARAFKGTGYKLGTTEDDTVVIPGAADPVPPREVTLRLWRDGFTVDDGGLRSYTDPANKTFLDSITRGEIPHELQEGNKEVHLSMEDRRMESFKIIETRRSTRPFTGHGYTLGSPTPPVVGASADEDKPVNEAKAKEQLALDKSKPVTSLQIRLADGSRLVGQFNNGHTIGHVRNFIRAARPQYQTRGFNLLSSYPTKVLEDAETLEDAGLLNAAIMQKLT